MVLKNYTFLTPNIVYNVSGNLHKGRLNVIGRFNVLSRAVTTDAHRLIQFVWKNYTFLTPNVLSNANRNLHKGRLNAIGEIGVF